MFKLQTVKWLNEVRADDFTSAKSKEFLRLLLDEIETGCMNDPDDSTEILPTCFEDFINQYMETHNKVDTAMYEPQTAILIKEILLLMDAGHFDYVNYSEL